MKKSDSLKFPPSVEIKRAIAATERAGIEISSVEIQPSKITIYARNPKDKSAPAELSYSEWKARNK